MPLFEYYVPSNVIIGNDIDNRIGEFCDKLGKRVVVVLENSKYISDNKIGERVESSIKVFTDEVLIYDELERSTNNQIKIDNLKDIVQSTRPDIIVGVGGYHVLSVAKTVASIYDKILSSDDVFKKRYTQFRRKRVSYIEVPITFGIVPGLSKSCFVYDKDVGYKTVYSDMYSYADAVIFDTSLISFLPPYYIGTLAVDAMAVAFDAFISRGSTPISDALSYKAIETFYVNIKKFINEPSNINIIQNLCYAGVMASISVSLSSPGLSTSIAQAVNSILDIPSERVSSVIFPHIIDYNLTSVPGKLIQTAMALGEKIQDITVIEAAIKSAESIRKLLLDLNIPLRLSEIEYFDEKQIDKISDISSRYDFMALLPRPANRNEINAILQAAL
ncbi:MAG: iron-containing alcohol dehydrogenase [Spirochaetia bacterium]|nr:iron-containing alcohol dehydrogenase [Spirochaetota bacterium]MCX8096610.1 iron-containing alcohol dehydrogenase [Spirochaetota bacterium]MDW8112057.1 iron-containing alcohol dehydrogenase [Spirochaetia bacterium]